MKILLAIPSYKRPYVIDKRTGYWLKQLKDVDWKIFIRSEEFLYYSQVFDSKNLVEINVNSFRETINAISEYAIKNNYDIIHKVDDDMSFKRIGKSKKENCAEVYQELYSEILEKFKEDGSIGAISVCKPMYHVMAKMRGFQRKNKAIYGNFFIKPKYMQMPEGIELFDDIFFTLQILKDNCSTLTYCNAYEDAICLKNQGGLQTMNRNEASKRTIEVMKKYFPEIKVGNYKDQLDVVDIDLKHLGIK